MKVFKRSLNNEDEIIIINLEPDELLLESVLEYLKDSNIKNSCVVSGIGTLKKLSYHRVLNTDYNPQNEFLTIEGPIELSSLQGLILNLEPHLHFVASDLENVYTGHLEYNSQILYLAEIMLITLKEFNLIRMPDPRNVFYIKDLRGGEK